MRPGDQKTAVVLAFQAELTGLGLLPPGDERTPVRELLADQPCGTVAAFYRHRRHGDKPCADCKTASNAYRAELRASRKAAAA